MKSKDKLIKIFAAYPWNTIANNEKDSKKNKYSLLAIREIISRVENRIENYELKHPNVECPKIFYSRLRATSGSFVLSSIRERMSSAYAIIFDITDTNPNVMIELGIALELQQYLHRSAKIFLIACAEKYNDSLIPSDIRGYFLSTYWIDEKTNKVTFGDGNSLVMRIFSDILESRDLPFIEKNDEQI